jgi:hypothetical protein
MGVTFQSQKRAAHLAGYLYLAMALASAFGLIIVPKIIQTGNLDETLETILQNEFMYRSGIASLLVTAIISVYLVVVLYKLLKPVDVFQANTMVIFVNIQVAIYFILQSLNFTTLMLAKGKVLPNLSLETSNELAIFFTKIYSYGILLLELLWGLWLIPLSLLIYKSGFMPKWLGLLLLAAAAGYLLDSFAAVILPSIRLVTRPLALTASGISELSTIAWLIIWGTKSTLNSTSNN